MKLVRYYAGVYGLRLLVVVGNKKESISAIKRTFKFKDGDFGGDIGRCAGCSGNLVIQIKSGEEKVFFCWIDPRALTIDNVCHELLHVCFGAADYYGLYEVDSANESLCYLYASMVREVLAKLFPELKEKGMVL